MDGNEMIAGAGGGGGHRPLVVRMFESVVQVEHVPEVVAKMAEEIYQTSALKMLR